MFAFHHVRNVFDSPGQKPGFSITELIRPQPGGLGAVIPGGTRWGRPMAYNLEYTHPRCLNHYFSQFDILRLPRSIVVDL
jgi:hypothetical protein